MNLSPIDQALHDYYYKKKPAKLILHNDYGNPEEMPLEVFFRTEPDLLDIDLMALELADGSVLDMGAGTGVHTKILQKKGVDVTAIEISKKATEIMSLSGVEKVVNDSFYNHKVKYDTLLLLMNGFGLAETINQIPMFLKMLKSLLKPNGKVLVDSSDLSYMKAELKDRSYFGEVQFCYEYKHILGDWFKWLYIDQNTLQEKMNENDWSCDILYTDDYDQYLALLKPNDF